MRTVDYVRHIAETAEQLQQLEDKESNPRLHKRVQLLRLLKSGCTPYLSQACRLVGLSEKHGRDLWRKYREQGWAGYVRLDYLRCKRGKLSAAQEAQVNRQAAREGFASQAEVQRYLLTQFGVSLAKSNVSKLLRRLEVTAKVPRPRNRRTSEEAQKAYKKTIVSG
jgi:transposase